MDQKIIVYGSSISWGAWDKEGGWVERLKKDTSTKTIESREEYYCMLYNLGISGDTSSGILRRFEKELQLRYNETDQTLIVIFEVGINDSMYINNQKQFQVPPAVFKSNIRKLFDIAKKYTDKIVFVGGTPVVDSLLDPIPWHTGGTYKTSYVEKFNKILLNLCLEKKGIYIDIFSPFKNGDLNKLISPDGAHPNSDGHKVIYEKVKKVLADKGWL